MCQLLAGDELGDDWRSTPARKPDGNVSMFVAGGAGGCGAEKITGYGGLAGPASHSINQSGEIHFRGHRRDTGS
jgi:hypothetical protein